MMNNSGIYSITNTVNGKMYIGSAVSFSRRRKQHEGFLSRGKHHSRHLQRAWNKHGADVFEFKKLLVCAPSMLLLYEQLVIDGYKPAYNVSPTARSRLGAKMSEESRAKIAAAQRGKKRGPRSPEVKARIAATNRGKKRTAETIARISASHIGKKYPSRSAECRAKAAVTASNQWKDPVIREKMIAAIKRNMPPVTVEMRAQMSASRKGRRPSSETLKKMSIARKGYKWSQEQRAKRLGFKHSQETKELLSMLAKARGITPENRAKMTAARAEKYGTKGESNA